MWKSRTKEDLIIEVWEALDCESVGEREIVAIENEVRERFGDNAVDLPMRTARLLADEGAELRHSEILEIDVKRRTGNPFEKFFRTIFTTTELTVTLESIRRVDDLRRRSEAEGDKGVSRSLRETAIAAKERCKKALESASLEPRMRAEAAESAQWIQIWLESPEVFEHWIALRIASEEFASRFPERQETKEDQPF